jgi:hypothetical protein
MTAAKFMQVFPVGKRPKKLNVISSVTSASGDKIQFEGVYPVPFKIDKKKFVYNIHVLKHLSEDFILGINFFQDTGLAYDPRNQEIFLDRKSRCKLETAELQCPAKLTLEPTSNGVVTLKVITRRGYPC